MSGQQPQGKRSGEGSSSLWSHIREDDQQKPREPDSRPDGEAQQQYSREADREPSPGSGLG